MSIPTVLAFALNESPVSKPVLILCGLFFLVAVGKGGADMFRTPSPDAPKPTLDVWLSRLVPWLLSLFSLVVIITVLSGAVKDLTGLRPLGYLMALFTLAQLYVAIRAWISPGKMMMRIIHTILFVCAVAIFPVYGLTH